MGRTGLATLREWRELGLVPWSWVAPASGPPAGPGHGDRRPLSRQAAVWGTPGPCLLSSILLPPGGWCFVSHHFAQLFWGLLVHLHSTLWAPHLCPTLTPCSMAGGGPTAWGVPSSMNCIARGLLAQPPGSHFCSASLWSAWGPLEKHGAGPPCLEPSGEAWTRTAPGVNRSSQGAPEGCAQTCGPCPTCGNPELPPALCPSRPGAGPLLSQHSLHSGRLSGCGLCRWCFLCACGGACVLSTYMSV